MLSLVTMLALAGCGGGGGGSAGSGSGGGSSSSSGGGSSSSGGSSGGNLAICHPNGAGTGPAVTAPNWLSYIGFPGTGVPATSASPGVMVVPTASPTTAPVYVTTNQISQDAFISSLALDSSSNVVAASPYADLYTTKGASGGDHLFLLPLTGTAAPVPVQLSNLSFAAGTDCQIAVAPTTLSDPTSNFVLLQLQGPDGRCDTADDQVYEIPSTASATTSPATMNLTLAGMVPFYTASGSLSGILMSDSSGNLNFYADATFTSPKVLLSNVRIYQLWYYTGQYGYFWVYSVPSGSSTVYRIDNTGAITDVYDGQNGGSIAMSLTADKSALIITDNVVTINGTLNESIVRIPIGNGGSTVLYTQTGNSNITPQLNVGPATPGGMIVYVNKTATSQALSLDLMSATVPSTPSPIYTAPNSQFLGVQAINGNDIYLSDTSAEGNKAVVLNAANGAAEQSLSGATFMPLGNGAPVFTGLSAGFNPLNSVIEVTGITSTNSGDMGGGTLNRINFGTCDVTPLTNPNGSPYVVPSGSFIGLSGTPGGVGPGYITVPAPTTQLGNEYDAVAYDLNNNIIVQLTNTVDTNELPFPQ